jgi:hypothetical protein
MILGKYRLVGLKYISDDRVELLFEGTSDPLAHVKFSKEGQTSIVVVSIATSDKLHIGKFYTLEAHYGEVAIKT